MKQTSTQTQQPMIAASSLTAGARARGPKKETLAFLRQFARAYQPTKRPFAGVVLN